MNVNENLAAAQYMIPYYKFSILLVVIIDLKDGLTIYAVQFMILMHNFYYFCVFLYACDLHIVNAIAFFATQNDVLHFCSLMYI